MPNFSAELTLSGIQSVSTTVTSAGTYLVQGKLSIPTLSAGSSGVSAVVAVVNQNGSAVYTGAAGAEGFQTTISCAALDVLQVVLTSAAAVDNALNAVKAVIAIG